MILFFCPKIEISFDLVEFVLDGELYDPIVSNMGFRRDTTMGAAPTWNSLAASSKSIHISQRCHPQRSTSHLRSLASFFARYARNSGNLARLWNSVICSLLRTAPSPQSQAKLNYLSIFKGHTELSHDYTVNIWFLVVYLDVIVAVGFSYTEKILHVQHTINM